MKSLIIALISFISLSVNSCDGNTVPPKQQAQEVAKTFIFEAKEKAESAMEIIKDELSSDEVKEFEQEFKSEVERLMAQLRIDAEAFVERMQSGEDIEAIREEIIAYREKLSPEAAEEFMTSFSAALSKMIEGSELGL